MKIWRWTSSREKTQSISKKGVKKNFLALKRLENRLLEKWKEIVGIINWYDNSGKAIKPDVLDRLEDCLWLQRNDRKPNWPYPLENRTHPSTPPPPPPSYLAPHVVC